MIFLYLEIILMCSALYGQAFDTIGGFIPFLKTLYADDEAKDRQMATLLQENMQLREERDSLEEERISLSKRVAELSGKVEPLKDEVESARKAAEEAEATNKGLVFELSMAKDTVTAREEALQATKKALEDKASLLDMRLREFYSLSARHEDLQRKHAESEARHQEILAKRSAEINSAFKERDEAKETLTALQASFTEKVKEEVDRSTVNLVANFLDEVDRQWPFKGKDDMLELFLRMVAPETVDVLPTDAPEQS